MLIFGSEVPLIVLMKFALFRLNWKWKGRGELLFSYMLIGFYIFCFVCFDDDITHFQKNLSNKPKDFSTGRYHLMLTLF